MEIQRYGQAQGREECHRRVQTCATRVRSESRNPITEEEFMRQLGGLAALTLVAMLVFAPIATAQQMNTDQMMDLGRMMDDDMMVSPYASASATPSATASTSATTTASTSATTSAGRDEHGS